jgi:hypothetical protein
MTFGGIATQIGTKLMFFNFYMLYTNNTISTLGNDIMFTRYLGYTDLPVKKSWHIYRVPLAEIRWNWSLKTITIKGVGL